SPYGELYVERAREILLDVHLAVSECGQCLGSRELERSNEVVRLSRDSHSLSAAASCRLDDDGKSDLASELEGDLRILDTTRSSRNDGHSHRLHRIARCGLVSHDADLFSRTTDERNRTRSARLGEFCILGEESIARMNRIG